MSTNNHPVTPGSEAPSQELKEERPVTKKGRFGRYLLLMLVFVAGLAVGGYLIESGMRQKLSEWLHPAQKAAHKEHATTAEQGKPGERKILYWTDPMLPGYKSDKPGKSPMGMELVPVYADQAVSEEKPPEGAIQLTTQRQQMVGVEVGEVVREPITRKILTVGRLAYDETKVAHIHTKVEGWIEKTYVDFVGILVKKNQPLVTIYSPELFSTQQELILAKKSRDYFQDSEFKEVGSGAISLYQATRARLRLWDISEQQIDEIEKRAAPMKTLTLYSPIEGFVQTRGAFPGLRVTSETELYAIADLSTIWVLADIYEYELPMVQVGQTATMQLSYFPGEIFAGKVSYIYPDLNKETRTLKIRLEFPNPDYRLKPDMYANVELKKDLGVQTSVPASAVLDSGTEQIVFVALDNGYFAPRKVVVGPKLEERYIIESGLEPGERIVTSGNFLIDSESKLKSAVGAMGGHGQGAAAGAAPKKQEGKAQSASQDHSRHK